MEGGDLTFYWNLYSQPARAVKALLELGHVAHTEVVLDLMSGESRGEEFLKINPQGQVPFIVEGDFKLGESNAILKYLAETRSTIPATLWPTDLKERAYVDSLLEWHHNHFRPALVAVLRAKLGSIKHGHPAPPEVLAFLGELRKPILDVLETLLGKKEGGFLAGEHLTLADLQIFFEATDEELFKRNFDEYPKIKAWYSKVGQVKEVKEIQEKWAAGAAAFSEKLTA